MGHEYLDNLVRARQLSPGPATSSEIDTLIQRGIKKLHDSKNDDLDPESRFDLVYNAAHALALAALRYAGYRSESRYLVLDDQLIAAMIRVTDIVAERVQALTI